MIILHDDEVSTDLMSDFSLEVKEDEGIAFPPPSKRKAERPSARPAGTTSTLAELNPRSSTIRHSPHGAPDESAAQTLTLIHVAAEAHHQGKLLGCRCSYVAGDRAPCR